MNGIMKNIIFCLFVWASFVWLPSFSEVVLCVVVVPNQEVGVYYFPPTSFSASMIFMLVSFFLDDLIFLFCYCVVLCCIVLH